MTFLTDMGWQPVLLLLGSIAAMLALGFGVKWASPDSREKRAIRSKYRPSKWTVGSVYTDRKGLTKS